MAEHDTLQRECDDVVIDDAKTSLSDLWKHEDCWAIWLGFIVLAVGLSIFLFNPPSGMHEDITKFNTIMKDEANRAPFKTIAWHEASKAKSKLRATNENYAKKIKKFLDKPHSWKYNPLGSIYMSKRDVDAKNAKGEDKYFNAIIAAGITMAIAKTSENAASDAGFKDKSLNERAVADIASWLKAENKASKAKKKISNKPYNLIPSLIVLCIFLMILFGVGLTVMGNPPGAFIKGFIFVFLLSVIAYMVAAQQTNKNIGLGYPLWAILFGMLISNTIGTPKWAQPAIQTEFYIKTGLVLLGAEILFGKILAIGLPGIFVAWIVTPVVLISTYWFGQKIIKMPSKTLNITISADMSVCGVSAAIATASACRAKKEELTLAIGMSMVFTAIMMFVMPTFIKSVGMHHVLGGAWMGGTIDSTGAVAAAGAFLSDRAMYVAATIKMIQNILIGVLAFFVALYWCTKVERKPGERVRWMEIWYRFPKFVIGFIGASIIFSLIYSIMGTDVSSVTIDHGVIKGYSKILRGWLFCLAFSSIGLATDFRELKKYFKGGKPLILYVCGQFFNIIMTLIMAYIMFFLLFHKITERI